MIEFTVIILYNWSKYGDDIKEMLHNNKLKWNSTKIKNLTKEELVNEYKRFKVDSYFKIDTIDSDSDYNCGSSGIYENDKSNIMIKIIKSIDNKSIDNKMLLIYKGDKERLYTNLVEKCRDIGCLVIRIVDDEVVFKERINVDLINSINDIQGENEIRVKNFIEKTKTLGEINEMFSDDFKNQWIKCIRN